MVHTRDLMCQNAKACPRTQVRGGLGPPAAALPLRSAVVRWCGVPCGKASCGVSSTYRSGSMINPLVTKTRVSIVVDITYISNNLERLRTSLPQSGAPRVLAQLPTW